MHVLVIVALRERCMNNQTLIQCYFWFRKCLNEFRQDYFFLFQGQEHVLKDKIPSSIPRNVSRFHQVGSTK